MRKIYQADVHCENCLSFPQVTVAKGTTVKQQLAQNKECDNCGVKALKEVGAIG